MAILRLTQVIRRPVEAVFRTVTDVGNFPKWNPSTPAARALTGGEAREGSRFELTIKGFGKTLQELQEFKRNERVRLVPHVAILAGGHRFRFVAEGQNTRIEHELEMAPKGLFKLFAPLMGVIGKKNLQQTATALQRYLERPIAPFSSERQ